VKELDNIFILREFSSSGSSSRSQEDYDTDPSNIVTQILGRMRNDGNAYWLMGDETSTSFPKTLWEWTNQGYENVQSNKTKLLHKMHEMINKKKYFRNSFKNHYIRPFCSAFILNKYFRDNISGEVKTTVLNTFNQKFSPDCLNLYKKYNSIIEKFENKESIENDLDYWINDYLNLENKMIIEYGICLKEYGNYDGGNYDGLLEDNEDDDFYNMGMDEDVDKDAHKDGDICENENKERRTGGGKSKCNISTEEREIGIRCFTLALQKSGHDKDGNSLFFKDVFLDYDGSYMHSCPKEYLSDSERTLSQFAIPMTGLLDNGLNCVDVNSNPIIPFIKGHGITVNYDLLVTISVANGLYGKQLLRTEKEITEILYWYNFFQKNGTKDWLRQFYF